MKQLLFSSIIIVNLLFFSFVEASPPDEWRNYYRKNENIAIKSSDGMVKRIDDKNLSLKLSTGKEIVLTDKVSDQDDPNQMRYVFRTIDSTIGGYLVDIRYYEDFQVLFVRFTDGDKQKLSGSPIYNPSKTKFICIKDNPLLETEIHIYRIKNFQLIEEFYKTPPEGVENVKWLSDSELSLDLYWYKSERNAKGEQLKEINTIHILYSNQKWKVVEGMIIKP